MPQPVDLQLERWGETGPNLLLIHGLTGRASLWAQVAKELESSFRVIAPDLRGHGRSPRQAPYTLEAQAADIIALLEATGPAHLVGHSMGAAVSWCVASARPDLVRGLVLEDQHPEARPDAWRGWQDWASAWPAKFATREEGIEFLRAAGRSANWWVPSLVEQPGGGWGWAFDFDAMVAAAKALNAQEQWDRLGRLSMPTLLIRGGDSPHLRAEVADRMARTIPLCRLVTVPGADHWVHRDPVPYARLLSEFLRE